MIIPTIYDKFGEWFPGLQIQILTKYALQSELSYLGMNMNEYVLKDPFGKVKCEANRKNASGPAVWICFEEIEINWNRKDIFTKVEIIRSHVPEKVQFRSITDCALLITILPVVRSS